MSKPSFASLLRRASADRADAVALDAPPAAVAAPFAVDPARVRLWPALGAAATTPEACAAMLRDGQAEPVIVRPVFDDEHAEYEVIAGAADFAAIRRLREEDPAIPLLVRVELVDDAGAAAIAARAQDDPLRDAFDGAVPAEAVAALGEQLAGPLGDAIRATAVQVARAQAARRADGLAPYPAAEVLRLLEAVGEPAAPTAAMTLSISDADARSVTFRLAAAQELTPEMLARVTKAMIDGAAGQGFVVALADNN